MIPFLTESLRNDTTPVLFLTDIGQKQVLYIFCIIIIIVLLDIILQDWQAEVIHNTPELLK